MLKGSYCLTLKVKKDLRVIVKSGREFFIKEGVYTYCGSAMGGLKRRIERHLKGKKRKHWHIDFLTCNKNVEVLEVSLFEGRRIECEVARELSKSCREIEGFGASDCKCRSHLFKIESPEVLAEVVERFKGKILKGEELWNLENC